MLNRLKLRGREAARYGPVGGPPRSPRGSVELEMTSVPSGGEVSLEVPGSPWETPTPASEGSSLRKDLSGTATEVMEGIRKVSSISSLGRRPTFEEIDTEILQKLFVSSPLPDLRRLESGGSDKEDVPEPPELDLQERNGG